MTDYNLGRAHGTVVIDSDTKGVDQAKESLDGLDKKSKESTERLRAEAEAQKQAYKAISDAVNTLKKDTETWSARVEAANARVRAAEDSLAATRANSDSSAKQIKESERLLALEQAKAAKATERLQRSVESLTIARSKLKDHKIRFEIDRSGIDGAVGSLGELASAGASAGNTVASGGARAASAMGSVGGAIGGVAIALVALGAGVPALILLGNAAISAAGAIALIPGALASGGAVLGTLGIGVMGVTDALEAMQKSHQGAAGAAADNSAAQRAAANAVRSAETQLRRAVEDSARSQAEAFRRTQRARENLRRVMEDAARSQIQAAKQVEAAEKDLAKAYDDAKKHLRDLTREIQRNALEQEEASQSVEEAQKALTETLNSTDADQTDRNRAILNLKKAQAAMEDTKVAASDLAEEQAKIGSSGVEGTEQVIEARDRLTAALEAQAQSQIQSDRAMQDARDQLFDAEQAQDQARIQSDRAISDARDQLAEAQIQAIEAQKKAMSGGSAAADAYAEALARLSPNAQAFVKKIEELLPRFRELQNAIQDALFSGIDTKIQQLADTYLPILNNRLVQISGALNKVATDFLDMLMEAENAASVDRILSNTTIIVENLGRALAPLGQAFLDIADVGSEVFAELSKDIGPLAEEFANWIRELKNSGELKEWIMTAVETIKDIGVAIWEFGEGVIAIFKGLGEGFLESEGGADSAGQSIRELAEEFSAWAQSPEAQEYFKELGRLARDFFDILKWVIGLLVKINMFFTSINPVKLAKNFFGWLGELPGKLEQAAIEFGVWLSELPGNIQVWIGELGATLVQKGKDLWNGFVTGVKSIWDDFTNWLSNIGETAKTNIGELWETLKQKGSDLWNGFWDGVEEVWNNFWTWVAERPTAVSDALGELWETLKEKGRNLWNGFWDGVKEVWNDVKTWFQERPAAIRDFFVGAKDWVMDKGRDIINGVRDGVADAWHNVGRWFRELPGNIKAILRDAPEWLVETGKDIIRGILRGLQEFAHKVIQKMGEIVRDGWYEIIRFLAIGSPSKRAIWMMEMFGEGLVIGLNNSISPVEKAALALAKAATVEADSILTMSAITNLGSTGTISSQKSPLSSGLYRTSTTSQATVAAMSGKTESLNIGTVTIEARSIEEFKNIQDFFTGVKQAARTGKSVRKN